MLLDPGASKLKKLIFLSILYANSDFAIIIINMETTKPYHKRDKLVNKGVRGNSINYRDFRQAKSVVNGENRKVPPYKSEEGKNKTLTVNSRFGLLKLGFNKGMTAAKWRVLWVLLDEVGERDNRVKASERRIAYLADVSRSTAHSALAFFVKEDVIVRENRRRGKFSWMVNPELAWKWRYASLEDGLAEYQALRGEIQVDLSDGE